MGNKILFMGLLGPVQINTLYGCIYAIIAAILGLFVSTFSVYIILSFIKIFSDTKVSLRSKLIQDKEKQEDK